ncbi:MAG TPA: hypothetical protein VHK28_00405, partial [Candidatus Limnocylindria bacterium]|nr:hypothetical protein [Candidatus Limnocylindria bacterium]
MPAARAPRALLSAVLFVVLLASATTGRAAAADPPSLTGPAPFETRSGQAKGSGSPQATLTTGRLIVQYREGASQAVRAAARAAIGARLVTSVSGTNTELLEAPAGVDEAVVILEHRSDVVSVTPEYRRTL